MALVADSAGLVAGSVDQVVWPEGLVAGPVGFVAGSTELNAGSSQPVTDSGGTVWNLVPQYGQNLAPPGISSEQFGHLMILSSLLLFMTSYAVVTRRGSAFMDYCIKLYHK